MLNFYQIWILLAFISYRFMTISLPIFEGVRNDHFWTNLSVGLTADLALALGLVLILEFLKPVRWRSAKIVSGLMAIAMMGLFVFCLGANLRYLEHFGMSVRPYHIASLGTGGLQGAAFGIAMESWRIRFLLFGTPVIAYALTWFIKKTSFSWRRIIIVTFLGISFNAISIQLRWHPGVHSELRYHFIRALQVNYIQYQRYISLGAKFEHGASPEKLSTVRELFDHQDRKWDTSSQRFPLWQKKITNSNSTVPESFKTLKRFVTEGPEPKNIVVVLLESIIAKFVSELSNQQEYKTPYLDQIIRDNLSFTEMIASGAMTKDGQIAALCSLYSLADFPLMAVSPMTRVKCLPDFLKKRGYDTAFFHPADNGFDNKQTFYQYHSTRHIVDQSQFPLSTSKGGWGYSDHSLFNKAMADFPKMKQPFQATILTLTNHAPFTVPSDAPKNLFGKTVHSKVVNYVDWAFGKFYKEFFEKYPNSVMLIMSDQGISYGEPIDTETETYDQVRRLFRMPLIIASPQLPKSLRGIKFNKLVSNVDVTPTILNLLEIDEPNQFMGENLFTRTNPIYTNFFERFLKIEQFKEKVTIMDVEDDYVDMLTILGHNNQFMPPERS